TDAASDNPAGYWDQHGWNTTLCVCVGIGAFGLLQFLIGLVALPTPRLLKAAVSFVLFMGGPLLVVAGLTGFGLAVWSVVEYAVWDDSGPR
ncbi:MAG: hypothetical protein ABEL76_04070, partial [Bradymonadaceae bacterium]